MSAAPGRPKQARPEGEAEGIRMSAAPCRPHASSPRMSRAMRTGAAAGALLFAVLTLALAPLQAHAGRSCEPARVSAASVTKGMDLAQKTADSLDASGARVVLLARAGQDLGKYGLRYSHLGMAYKTEAGPWRVVHKLNECGRDVASIYRQGLAEFFLDDPWRYEAAWVVPTPAVQAQLLRLLETPSRITRLHVPAYSLVSYAWGDQYQQSNQWAIETLAAAMEPETIVSRQQAQAWLQFKGYQPTVLKLGPLTRLGGRMVSANIAFDDHPNSKRFADQIETVTVDSVFAWMPRAGLGAAPVILQP